MYSICNSFLAMFNNYWLLLIESFRRQRLAKSKIAKIGDYKKHLQANQNNYKFMTAWRAALFFIKRSADSFPTAVIDNNITEKIISDDKKQIINNTNSAFVENRKPIQLAKNITHIHNRISSSFNVSASAFLVDNAVLKDNPKLKFELSVLDPNNTLLAKIRWNAKWIL